MNDGWDVSNLPTALHFPYERSDKFVGVENDGSVDEILQQFLNEIELEEENPSFDDSIYLHCQQLHSSQDANDKALEYGDAMALKPSLLKRVTPLNPPDSLQASSVKQGGEHNKIQNKGTIHATSAAKGIPKVGKSFVGIFPKPVLQAVMPAPLILPPPPNTTRLPPRLNMITEQEEKRERNRFHAHQSRMRRKSLTSDLQMAAAALREENMRLKERIGQDQANAALERGRLQSHERFINALKQPENRRLRKRAVNVLKKLQKDIPEPT